MATAASSTSMVKEFTLDFSGQSGVPSQWGIDVELVVKWFQKQAGHLEDILIVKDQKRGHFSVTSFDKATSSFLSSFILVAEKGTRKFNIPLKAKVKRSKPAVWVTIHRTAFGDMALLDNAYFDKLMEDRGATVIKNTEWQYYRGTKFRNGKRRVLIEVGDNHIGRQHSWEAPDGVSHDWFMTYRGQPFHCRKCDDAWHDNGLCPKWQNRSRDENEGQQRYVFFGTSMLRHCNDSKETRFDSVPGAKIGHLANHIDNDVSILPHAEVIVVAPIGNNEGSNFEELKVATVAQSTKLAEVLKPYAEMQEKSVFMVDPSIGPTEGDIDAFIRAEMTRCATRIGAGFVPLDHIILDPEKDMYDIHINESGMKKVLGAIQAHIQQRIGKDVLGNFSVSKQPYMGQRISHHKVGCPRCTFLHTSTTCPPPPALTDASVDLNATPSNDATPALIPSYSAIAASSSSSSSASSPSANNNDNITSAITATSSSDLDPTANNNNNINSADDAEPSPNGGKNN